MTPTPETPGSVVTGTSDEAERRAAAQRRVANRLRRARGQLDAVITAVESGTSCRDVVTQLAAVSHALHRAGFVVVANAMEDCVTEPDKTKNPQGMTTDELEKLFLTLA